MNDDSPVLDRSAIRLASAVPLVFHLFFPLAVVHAIAASADLLPRGAGLFAASMDAIAAAAVLLGLVAHRWGVSEVIGRFVPVWFVFAVAFAGAASGARAAAAGRPWLAADVVLAALATVAVPAGHVAFAAALTGVEAAWVIALVAGTTVGMGEQVSGDWVLLGFLSAGAVVIAIGIRRSQAWLLAQIDAAGRAAGRQAVTDLVTGANNRRGLERLALPMIEHARRQGEAVHCLFLDVDDFRQVNEQLGHGAGDDVLRAVHEALLGSIRATDAVARWSGDQFVVVGPGTGTSPLEMERRVHGHLSSNPPVQAGVWGGAVSIGSATLVPWDEGNVDSLFARAEEDMYLRRSLRRQGRTRSRSGPGPGYGQVGAGPPDAERPTNPPTVPPTVPPVARDQP